MVGDKSAWQMDNVTIAHHIQFHPPMVINVLSHHAHKLLIRMDHVVLVMTTTTGIQKLPHANQKFATIDKRLQDREHALIAQLISILLITRETAIIVHVINLKSAKKMENVENAQVTKLFKQLDQMLERNVWDQLARMVSFK